MRYFTHIFSLWIFMRWIIFLSFLSLDFCEVIFFTHKFSLWIFLRWVSLLTFVSLRFWWGYFTHIFSLGIIFLNLFPLDFCQVIFFTHKFSLWIFLRWVILLAFVSLRFWWGNFAHIFSLGFLWGELFSSIFSLRFLWGNFFYSQIFSLDFSEVSYFAHICFP